MKITFAKPELPAAGVVVVGVLEDSRMTASAEAIDRALEGALARAMEANRFKGKKDQTVTLLAPAGTDYERIVVLGLGKAEDLTVLRLHAVGGQVCVALAGGGHKEAVVMVDAVDGCLLAPEEMAVAMAEGLRLRSYRFDRYLTKEKAEDKPALKEVEFRCDNQERAHDDYRIRDKVLDGVFLTRDLVSEPGNVLYPETLAEQARRLAKLGVEVEILGESEMRKLGMNALLGVGQGSARDSQLVVMQWLGASGDEDKGRKGKKSKGKGKTDKDGGRAPIAFVGKGVTFDSGGISIKPSANMEDMKWDMGGAGTVMGLMRALAARKARVDVVGVAGLVENMPSGTAQRPGDVVTSMSGQTIEILNTDAEGRLVLADALHYCIERFKPRLVVDLATLTGAMIIALGHERAGLFSNDDALAERLLEAGEKVGELLWRFPMAEEYDKQLKSEIADMKNIGNRGAGSITAAQFLKRFVGETPWAHLDIAGVAWSDKDRPVVPKGGTGFGVRLLERLVADHYEDR